MKEYPQVKIPGNLALKKNVKKKNRHS